MPPTHLPGSTIITEYPSSLTATAANIPEGVAQYTQTSVCITFCFLFAPYNEENAVTKYIKTKTLILFHLIKSV